MKKKNDALAPKTSPRPPRKTADVGKWRGVKTTNYRTGEQTNPMEMGQQIRSANARGLDKEQLNSAKVTSKYKKDLAVSQLKETLRQGKKAALDQAAAAETKLMTTKIRDAYMDKELDKTMHRRASDRPPATSKPPRAGHHPTPSGAGGWLDNDSSTGAGNYSGYKKGGVVKKAMGGMVRGAGCATRGTKTAKQY